MQAARNMWLFEGEVYDPYQIVAYVHKLMAELHVKDRHGACVGFAAQQHLDMTWTGLR